MTITPLDTCGAVKITGDDFARVRDSNAVLAKAVMENYRIWHGRFGAGGPLDASMAYNVDAESSVLFDTVAIYLVYATALCKMVGILVTFQTEM